MQRLFLAVPISERIRVLLESRLLGTPLPGRLVPSANWHITLRFFGATPPPTAAALVQRLRDSGLGEPFNVTFGRLGAFPRPARASVVWMGIEDGAEALAGIATRVEDVTLRVGLPAADHPFRPHLTVSRLSPPTDVRSFLNRDLHLEEAMPVTEVVLFSSRPGNGPPVYEALERIPLTG